MVGSARRADRTSQRDILPKIVGLASDELFVGERSDFARFNQDDAIGILHLAFDEEKGFLSYHKPKPFEQIWLDNRI